MTIVHRPILAFILLLSLQALAAGPSACNIFLSSVVPHEFLVTGAAQLQANPNALEHSPKIFAAINESLRGDITHERLATLQRLLKNELGDERYDEVLGTYLSGGRMATVATSEDAKEGNLEADLRDMNRGYSWRMTRNDSPLFNHPKYNVDRAKVSGISGTGYAGPDPTSSGLSFGEEWEKIAPPEVRSPEAFYLTGSDAVDSFYVIAQRHFGKPVDLLSFAGMWMASRGRASAQSSLLGITSKNKHNVLPNPTTYQLNVDNPKELKRLVRVENEVIQLIRNKVKSKRKVPVRGIVIEPILGAKGVRFYRYEFLMRLRELCDELGILLFADEILTVAGRSGKFLAIEHYPGFFPDYIAVGKGLQVSGVSGIHRGDRPDTNRMATGLGRTTLNHYPEILLKSAYLMKSLREDKFFEQSTEVGAYFLSRLRQRFFENMEKLEKAWYRSRPGSDLRKMLPNGIDPKWRTNPEYWPRGVGSLIFVPYLQNVLIGNRHSHHQFSRYVDLVYLTDANGRLMPFVDMTKGEVDRLFQQMNEKEIRRRFKQE